jgi:glycosyltransferase involved in cell wall biosynthesis
MTPTGKNLNILIIYYGDPSECRDFCKKIGQYVNLTAAINAQIIMGDMSVAGSKLIQISFASDGTYKLVPVELISNQDYNLGLSWGQLAKVIKDANPDIIHIFNEYHCWPVTQLILIQKWLQNKTPVICYNFQNIDYANLRGGLKSRLISWIAKFNLRRIKGITSANQEGLDIALKYNPSLKTKKIFWPVDLNMFTKKEKAACRVKLDLPINQMIIGYVGRMTIDKGLEDLILAVKSLENVMLLLIGEGVDKTILEKFTKDNGLANRIIFKSFIAPEELADYYNALDCLILPSRTTFYWKEQYGRVLVEAMGCGTPIAGSSSGAISEVLEGYPAKKIFKEGDVSALISAIKELAEKDAVPSDPNFLNQFTTDHFVNEHIAFYKTLC